MRVHFATGACVDQFLRQLLSLADLKRFARLGFGELRDRGTGTATPSSGQKSTNGNNSGAEFFF